MFTDLRSTAWFHASSVSEHPEWETSVGDKRGRQVGDKCKIMRPRAPRAEDKCGRQEKHAAQSTQSGRQVWETSVGDKWETSVKSCGPEHPERKTSVGDKKSMRPRAPRVGDKCGRQGGDTCKSMRPRAPRAEDKCGRQAWETSGRQV